MKTQGRSEALYASLYDYLYGFSFYVKFIRWVYYWELKRIKAAKTIERAIDIGCGTGDSTKLLVKLKIQEIYGVDPNEFMLRIAKIKVPGAKFVQGSFENLSELFPENSFDLAVSIFGPLTRASDPRLAIAQVYRILRPQGIFAFDIFNRWSNTFVKRFGKYRVPWITFRKKLKGKRVKTKINLYDPKEIEALLSRQGFKIIKRLSLFNYVLPRYSVVTKYPLDIIKCLGDYCLGRLLRKTNGNIIIYIAKKL